jgi:putative transposase
MKDDPKDEMLKDLMQRMMELMMEKERDEHLGYGKNENLPKGFVRSNHRNGYYNRDYTTGLGLLQNLSVPRDRLGEFYPQLLSLMDRRTGKVDDLIVSLYAKGMSTRDITDVVDQIYDHKLSATTVSNLTKAIEVEREAWEKRPLQKKYIAIFIDALHVKVRRVTVDSDAVYLMYGIDESGHREVLGMQVGVAESALVWEQYLEESLKQRGVEQVLLFIMDGLPGLEEAVLRVYPKALTQRCVVHQVRNTLNRVRPRDKAALAEDLRAIYHSQTLEEAKAKLLEAKLKWCRQYPKLFLSWEANLESLMRFLLFPRQLHKILYTTNWLERLNKELRKVVKTKNSFPTEQSVRNLIYLKIKAINDQWENRKIPNFDMCVLDLQKLWEQRYRPSSVTQ